MHAFNVIACSEEIHGARALRVLKEIKSTEENLAESFESEKQVAEVAYDKFVKLAEAAGEKEAVVHFSQSRMWRKRTPNFTSRPCRTSWKKGKRIITCVRFADMLPMECCLTNARCAARKRNSLYLLINRRDLFYGEVNFWSKR